jgi:uncharacterized protein (DUF934 family)
MPLLKHGRVAEDIWVKVEDGGYLPDEQPALISHARWEAEKSELQKRNAPLGILLPNDLDMLTFGEAAGRFELIALNFPKFSDGRAYSQARLLRERFGYRGELRATGNVLRDQLLLMHRAGFDTFEVASKSASGPDAAEIFAKALSTLSVFYQPTGDGRITARDLRLRNLVRQEAAE